MKPDYADDFCLYTPNGNRKYLNRAERQGALATMAALPKGQALFALTLAWTGARLSEVLALTPSSFQIDSCVVAIRTLKRRTYKVREVPIPRRLVRRISQHFGLARMQQHLASARRRLWPWSRTTGWRIIKHVMRRARVVGGHATPRGLRHGFAIAALQAGVPLNIVQRWMGHARISTTAIYTEVFGPEERAFAQRFWNRSAARRE